MKKVLIHESCSPDFRFASLFNNDNRIVGTRITLDRQQIDLVNDTYFFRNKTVDCDFLIIKNQNDEDKNDQPKIVAVIAEAQLNRAIAQHYQLFNTAEVLRLLNTQTQTVFRTVPWSSELQDAKIAA
jgi:hypothetical protein